MARPVPITPWPREQVFAPGLLPVAASRHGLIGSVREHSHDFAEVVLMVRGEAWQTSSSGDFPLRPWQVVILPRGTWHGFRDCDHCEVLDCCIGLEALRRELAWTRDDLVLGPLIHALAPAADARPVLHHVQLTPEAGGRILAAAAGLAEALRERPGRAARLVASTLLLLDAFALELPASGLLNPPQALPPLVRRLLQLLAEDLARRWTLFELAARLDVDRSHLVRAVSHAIGAPPMAHLARLRAERAAELLETTSWPVRRIAGAVGWPEAQHFARRFRRHFGMSASAYRSRGGRNLPSRDGSRRDRDDLK